MKRLALRVGAALLTFAAGVGAAALSGAPFAPPPAFAEGWRAALAATLAGAACFGLTARSERARRRGAESDVASSLALLCLGFLLAGLGLGMFLRAFVPN